MSHQQQQVQPPAAPPLVTFVPPPAGLTGVQQPLSQQPQQQQQPPLIVQGLPPGFITAPAGQLPVAQPMSNPPTLFQAAGPTSGQQPQLQHQPITLVQTAGTTPTTTTTQMTTQMMMNSPPGSITSYSIGGSIHSQHQGGGTANTTNASSSNTFGGGGVSATLPTEVLAAVHGVCAPPPVTTGGGGAGNPLGSSLGGGSSRGNASGSGYSSNSGPGGALPLEVMAAVTSASSTAGPVFAQPQQQPQPLILSSSSAGSGGIAPVAAPFTAIGPPPPVVAKAAGEGEVGNQGFTVNKKIVYDKTNVFVSSIGLDVTEKQLEEVFSEAGKVVNCKILMEYSTGTSKGCGFVHYGTKEEANKAAEELNGRTIGKSSIRVRLADNCAEFGPEESNKLFVRNIPTAVNIEELKSAFSPFGLVVGGNIMPDTSREGRREGLGLNMGYVTFQDVSCAMTAARELQKRTDVFPSQKGTTSSHGLEIKPAESLQVRNLRKSPASGATSGHTTPLNTTTANAQLSVIPPQPGGAIQLAPSPAPVAVPHRAGGPPPPPQQVVVPLSGQLPVAPPQQQSTTLIPQSGSGQPAAAPAFISGALPTGGGLTSPVVTQPSPYPQSQQVITAAVAPPLTSGALPIAAPPNPTLTTTTGNGGTSISTNNSGGPPLLPSFSPNVPVGGGVAGVGTAGNGGTVLVASSPQFLQQQQQAPGAGHPQQVIFRATQ